MSVGGTCSVSGQMELRGNFTTVTAGHRNGNTWQKKDSNREHVALSAVTLFCPCPDTSTVDRHLRTLTCMLLSQGCRSMERWT